MLSPIGTADACGCAGSPAALTAPNDRAHNAASVRTMVGAFTNDVCSPRGEQSTVMVQQLVRRDEALDARPRLARGCAQQRERRVAHLVAAVGTEGLLGGEAVTKCAGVVLPLRDRKSTRLNSSHRCISYAVFCLKKKKHKQI